MMKWRTKVLGIVACSILTGSGAALAFDNYDGVPGRAWPSFYELNGFKFVKNYPTGIVVGSTYDIAFNNAGNGWNGKLKTLRWLFSSSGPSERTLYSLISSSELGRALVSPGTTITSCSAQLNSYALSQTGYTAQALKDFVAGHELGHCFGLGHSTVAPAMMRYGTPSESVAIGATPQTDDINGIKAHYTFEN